MHLLHWLRLVFKVVMFHLEVELCMVLSKASILSPCKVDKNMLQLLEMHITIKECLKEICLQTS